MLGIQGFQIKLIIDKIRPQSHNQGRAKINQIWDFLKTVKIRIPILYHQIELECQFSCLKVNAPTLLVDLTPKTASEYHKKSPKQRVESNFFKLKTLYVCVILKTLAMQKLWNFWWQMGSLNFTRKMLPWLREKFW